MIASQYLFLHFLLLCVLFLSCRKIAYAKDDSKYWKKAVFPIIAFSLEEGLRWGRDTDWNLYYNVYRELGNHGWTNHEPLFQLIWKTFAICGLPYPVVILMCSFLFILSLFVFFKPYYRQIWLGLPLLVASHLIYASNLIRWYIACSFALIAISYINEKRKKMAAIWLFVAFFCHYGILLAFCLLALGYKIKCIAKPRTAIVVCILLLFFFDKSVLVHFGFIFNIFNHVDRFAYLFSDGAAMIMGNGAGYGGSKDLITKCITFTPFFAFIIYGYRLMRLGKIPNYLYNILVIGSYLKLISSGLEIIGRYYYFVDFFVCLEVSFVFDYLKGKKKTVFSQVMLLLCITYIIRKFIFMCQPFAYDEFMLYVWNERIDPMELFYFRKNLML